MLSVSKIIPSCLAQCNYIGFKGDLGSASAAGVEVVVLHSKEGFTGVLGSH